MTVRPSVRSLVRPVLRHRPYLSTQWLQGFSNKKNPRHSGSRARVSRDVKIAPRPRGKYLVRKVNPLDAATRALQTIIPCIDVYNSERTWLHLPRSLNRHLNCYYVFSLRCEITIFPRPVFDYLHAYILRAHSDEHFSIFSAVPCEKFQLIPFNI